MLEPQNISILASVYSFNRPDIFQCTVLLNRAVQTITIETGLDDKNEPYYKVSMPDRRILFLELDPKELVWRTQSGEVTEESETIGDRIIESYM